MNNSVLSPICLINDVCQATNICISLKPVNSLSIFHTYSGIDNKANHS